MTDGAPLVLTLRLDGRSQETLDALRQSHFPAGLNHLAAHLTLFHALPGERLAEVATILAAAVDRPAFDLLFGGLMPLGRGVALKVAAPELLALRRALLEVFVERFPEALTAQDRRGFGPHVTIQNKVSPEAARDLRIALSATLTPFGGRGEGLMLWRYLGGPWGLEAILPFGAA